MFMRNIEKQLCFLMLLLFGFGIKSKGGHLKLVGKYTLICLLEECVRIVTSFLNVSGILQRSYLGLEFSFFFFNCEFDFFDIQRELFRFSFFLSELWISGFPGGSFQAGDVGLIPGSGRSSREENGNSLQYTCLLNPMGQRSMAGYSPWDCKGVRHDVATKQQWVQQFDTFKEFAPFYQTVIDWHKFIHNISYCSLNLSGSIFLKNRLLVSLIF